MQSCSHAVTEMYYGIMGSGGMCKRVLRFGRKFCSFAVLHLKLRQPSPVTRHQSPIFSHQSPSKNWKEILALALFLYNID
jgi:hypothetical protein